MRKKKEKKNEAKKKEAIDGKKMDEAQKGNDERTPND